MYVANSLALTFMSTPAARSWAWIASATSPFRGSRCGFTTRFSVSGLPSFSRIPSLPGL